MKSSKILNLKMIYPEIARQWHSTQNGELEPEQVTPGSNKKVWWQCERGHEWQTTIISRSRGSGCPYCGNRRLNYDNNLKAVNPELSKEWHPTKNSDLKPDQAFPNSGRKVWWKCKKGHEWEARISSRIRGSGCPYCSGRKASDSYNLEVVKPELCKEWHPVRNGDLTPSQVTPSSGKKAWWRCKKGHKWQEYIYIRTKGFGCPYCSGRRASHDYNLLVMNPGLAKKWHPLKNGELKPDQVIPGSSKKVWWQCEKGHEWMDSLKKGKKGICPYCTGRKIGSDNNLSMVHPDMAKQWHPTKNGKLKPTQVFFRAPLKVWWQCEEGHVWQAYVSARHKLMSGCPYCSKRKASSDYNLQIVKPGLAAQWHPTKNKGLLPTEVTPVTHKRVWWKCEKGHEWQARIANRYFGIGCPFCAGRKPSTEYCLATVNPGLATEWHPHKNGELTPDKVTPHSEKKVWWRCKRGHEWQATVNGRQSGTGCRICSYLDKKKRDLLIYENPGMAEEWHPTANGDLTPADFTAGSGRKVWWICKKGHEWKASISSRFRYKTGCPYCSNRKVCKDNCLSTVNPELAKQWHPTKNGGLKTIHVTEKSRKMVWWKCEKGHSWKSNIQHRSNGHGCPYCSGNRATKEYNLKISNPGLAELWHPIKNGSLRPDNVTPQSGLKVWWKCKEGHEWQTIVRNAKNRCPFCKN